MLMGASQIELLPQGLRRKILKRKVAEVGMEGTEKSRSAPRTRGNRDGNRWCTGAAVKIPLGWRWSWRVWGPSTCSAGTSLRSGWQD